jgi:aminoglycoside phosphotransferase family enzyme
VAVAVWIVEARLATFLARKAFSDGCFTVCSFFASVRALVSASVASFDASEAIQSAMSRKKITYRAEIEELKMDSQSSPCT